MPDKTAAARMRRYRSKFRILRAILAAFNNGLDWQTISDTVYEGREYAEFHLATDRVAKLTGCKPGRQEKPKNPNQKELF